MKVLLRKCMTHQCKQVVVRSQVAWGRTFQLSVSNVSWTGFSICDGALSWRKMSLCCFSWYSGFFFQATKWFKLVNCCWWCLVRTIFPSFNCYNIFWQFSCFLSLTSKSPLMKCQNYVHMYLVREHGHHKLLEVINMNQQQFSSMQKINAVCECFCFGINFDMLNTMHTLVQFIPSSLSDACWWHNKMVLSQIIITQTASVHHLMSEICIS